MMHGQMTGQGVSLRWLVLGMLVGACALWTGCGETEEPVEEITGPTDPSGDGEDGDDYEELDVARGKVDGLNFSDGPLVFLPACEEGDSLTIAAVGDLLIHARLQRQALNDPEGFKSLWGEIGPLLKEADVTYANLEGPTAAGVDARGRDVTDPGKVFDDKVYTSYPMFNYHPSLLDDLMDSGVDIVSTANNHSLDRWALGADRTIDELKARNLPYTGTRARGDESAPWHAITENNGFRLAWLACTYGTNGIPDRSDQVLLCYEDRQEVLDTIKELAADDTIDAVIVTPHWGTEYKATPNAREITLAHDMLEAGATAIIGSHPHVLQPWERYKTRDGRETFVIYSLGNFISGQRHLPRRSTLVLYLGLKRGLDGVVRVSGARYVPLHMTTFSSGRLTLQAPDHVDNLGDSRALTAKMFGHWNRQPAAPPLVINPECDPDWVAPHAHDGWVGGACAEDLLCGGATCDLEAPGGRCALPCERLCPDQAGHPGTFCVDASDDPMDAGTQGICVLQCAEDTDCRTGYTCQTRSRFKEDATERKVCVPAPAEPITPDE